MALEESKQETASQERQVVALELDHQIYGADIAHVHSVLPMPSVTPVPRTPPHVAGVMNLRGRILPVVDLRTRFGLPPLPAEDQARSRVVVIEAGGVNAGLIVDGVSTVLRLPESKIAPPSALVSSEEMACITGIGRIPNGRHKEDSGNERLILMLDVCKALSVSSDEAAALKSLDHAA